ncbi:MAG: ParB/RepB/Spo0J family partition protein [Clostridia bacterium]|nr:ParB/RepB/Spo0J family partition protein [Clostridia bacterium]
MSVMRDIHPSYRAVCYVPTALIRPRPYSARGDGNDSGLMELAASIRQYGLLQPVTVRAVEGGYEIVLGERRLQACILLGFSYIDAFVLQASEQEAALYSLLENIQQTPLHYFDLAQLFSAQAERGVSLETMARQTGKSALWVSRKLKLMQLAPDVREYIREAGLSECHAQVLLRVPGPEEQLRIARKAAHLHLSPRETEALIEKEGLFPHGTPPRRKVISMVWEPRLYLNAIRDIVRQMRDAGMKVSDETGGDDDWLTLHIKIRKR